MAKEIVDGVEVLRRTVKLDGKEVIFDFPCYGKSLCKCLKRKRFYEAAMLKFIRDRYGKGGTYIDIGSWCGTHALFFSVICEADKVYAFEPFHIGYSMLTRNISNNKLENKVDAFQVAIGDEDIQASLNKSFQIVKSTERGLPTCSLKRLDAILPDLADVKFIKMDIEGMELSALKGMVNLLKKCKPAFAIECHTTKELNAVEDFLEPLGYINIAVFNTTPTYIFESGSE